MGEKQCAKCGEMVDEAKAFCPGCGEAFVEERRRESVSNYDLSEHTVRLGDTLYNQMLQDMGLSISKQAGGEEAKQETVKPAIAAEPSARDQPVEPSRSRSMVIAIAIVAIGFAILALIVIAVAAILYFRQT